ncbi:Glutamyl-tRNA reductase [Bienertia sinuspersici]
MLLEEIRANENITAKSLNKHLFKRFGVQMTKSSLYRMKAQALAEIHGGFNVLYSYLPNYCDIIKSANHSPVAHCTWNLVEHPEMPLSFNCIFISFKGCLDGVVAGCRGLIRAIVSCKDERNWKFFIHLFKTLLQNNERGDNWCIISDRHKACTDLWPTIGKRFCCKNLIVNLKNVFPGPKMWQLFWLAASATSHFTFGKAMKQI